MTSNTYSRGVPTIPHGARQCYAANHARNTRDHARCTNHTRSTANVTPRITRGTYGIAHAARTTHVLLLLRRESRARHRGSRTLHKPHAFYCCSILTICVGFFFLTDSSSMEAWNEAGLVKIGRHTPVTSQLLDYAPSAFCFGFIPGPELIAADYLLKLAFFHGLSNIITPIKQKPEPAIATYTRRHSCHIWEQVVTCVARHSRPSWRNFCWLQVAIAYLHAHCAPRWRNLGENPHRNPGKVCAAILLLY